MSDIFPKDTRIEDIAYAETDSGVKFTKDVDPAKHYVTQTIRTTDHATGMILEHDETVVNFSTYNYPRARNTEVKAAAQRFGIVFSNNQTMSGYSFVEKVIARMMSELSEFFTNGEEVVYIKGILRDVLPNAVKPKSNNFNVLFEYFLGWLYKVRMVPDVVSACSTNCPLELEPANNINCTDATSQLHSMKYNDQLSTLTVTAMYPTYSKHLYIPTVLLLGELLSYNKPINLDMACTAVKRKLNSSYNPQINLRQAIDGLNSLLQAYDLLDSDDSAAFVTRVNVTAKRRNIVFQANLATAAQIKECNSTNMRRFNLVKPLLGAYGDSLQPMDLFKIHITDKLKVDTLTSILTTHAATSTMCLRCLERLLALTPTKQELNNPAYNDEMFLTRAEIAVGKGIYPYGTKYHPVGILSIEKRYLCLAFLEAYYVAKFMDYIRFNALIANEHNMYVLHTVFYRIPRYFKHIIEHGKTTRSADGKFKTICNVVRLLIDANQQMTGCLNREMQDDDEIIDGMVHFCYGTLACQKSAFPRIYNPVETYLLYMNILRSSVQIEIVAGMTAGNFVERFAAAIDMEDEYLVIDTLLPGVDPDFVFDVAPNRIRLNKRFI